MGNVIFVHGLIEEINIINVGERDKIVKEHIQKGAVALPGAMLKAWAKTRDKDGKGDIILLCYCTVKVKGIVKLGVPFRFATVTNGRHGGAGGECLGVENATLMEIKVIIFI